jgi:hypothetical protein
MLESRDSVYPPVPSTTVLAGLSTIVSLPAGFAAGPFELRTSSDPFARGGPTVPGATTGAGIASRAWPQRGHTCQSPSEPSPQRSQFISTTPCSRTAARVGRSLRVSSTAIEAIPDLPFGPIPGM